MTSKNEYNASAADGRGKIEGDSIVGNSLDGNSIDFDHAAAEHAEAEHTEAEHTEADHAEKSWVSSRVLFEAISETIASGMTASFTVTGMSMWPLICHGRDAVVVEKVKPDLLRLGDIVLLQTEYGNYILHRITKINGDLIETTGDGNFFRDGWFPKSCVIARVTQVKRPDKTFDMDSGFWKLYGRIWMFLYPIRRPMFTVWKRVRKVVRK